MTIAVLKIRPWGEGLRGESAEHNRCRATVGQRPFIFTILDESDPPLTVGHVIDLCELSHESHIGYSVFGAVEERQVLAGRYPADDCNTDKQKQAAYRPKLAPHILRRAAEQEVGIGNNKKGADQQQVHAAPNALDSLGSVSFDDGQEQRQ